MKYQNKKYIKHCDWHLKMHFVTGAVVERVFPAADGKDGTKDVQTSLSARAPLTEMVERSLKKHDILLS